MITISLVALLIALPLAAAIVEWGASSGISERHYSDHATYVISRSLSRVPAVIMALMSLLGLALGWMCSAGMFNVREALMLSFFASFVMVLFVMWASLRHYRVTTYDQYMQVRPFIGLTATIAYDAIERLRWSDVRNLLSNRSVSVVVDGKVAAVLVGGVDLDQILLHINRDDVIERPW